MLLDIFLNLWTGQRLGPKAISVPSSNVNHDTYFDGFGIPKIHFTRYYHRKECNEQIHPRASKGLERIQGVI
jgi:hypothetical protein